jgi:hypothetical protein
MNYGDVRIPTRAFTVLMLASTLILGFWSRAESGQGSSQSLGQLLRKSADIAEVQVRPTNDARQRITIRLRGLQPTDLVNIRPADRNQLEVAAGALVKSAGLQRSSMPVEPMEPGPALPDSAMEVTPAMVDFTRQPSHGYIVFVDIQVPRRLQVRVELDGKTILKASLRQPLSLRNQEWGQGASNSSGAIMQAAMPPVSHRLSSHAASHDGTYYVPVSRLQILNRNPIKGEAGQKVIVKLEINEAGQVVNVISMTEAPPSGLEDALRAWRFAPYEVDGHRVRVSTTLAITVE